MRAMVFANKSMASRGHLVEQARRWLDEAGTTPPGNGVERELWEARPQPPGLEQPAAGMALEGLLTGLGHLGSRVGAGAALAE